MDKGNFYKEIPWEGVNFTRKFAEIPGEYRHEKGVPQQGGGADNNWNSPFTMSLRNGILCFARLEFKV